MIDVDKLINPFVNVQHFESSDGYVVWRRGTGDNVELLHIRSARLEKGGGTRLLAEMVRRLRDNPPYATVFGFTRVENRASHKFYLAMGFSLTVVRGVYADGDAVVFSAPYTKLEEKLERWMK